MPKFQLMKIINVLIAGVMIFSLASSNAAQAKTSNFAQSTTSAPTCWAMDLVLLIDNSRSMYADRTDEVTRDVTPASDPLGYRFIAAKEVLDRLILNRREECPEAVNRLGIIAFGSNTTTVLPLIEINLRPEDSPGLWADQYLRKIETASQDRDQAYQYGTNPQLALMDAEKLFANSSMPPDPSTYGQRRKVVVYLTDGQPDQVGDMSRYMCNLSTYANSVAWTDASIWVVGLHQKVSYWNNDGCNGGKLGDDWRKIIESDKRSRKGQLIDLPYNEQAIPYFVLQIVNAEFGRPGVEIKCGNNFFVDPYLQRVTFTFFRQENAPNLLINLKKLDGGNTVFEVKEGKVLTNTLGTDSKMTFRYTQTSLREDYQVDLPRPGTWRFDVGGMQPEDCQRRVNATEVVKAGASLLLPNQTKPLALMPDAPYHEEGQTFDIMMQTDDGQQIFPETDYPLQVTVNWSLPDGKLTLPDGKAIEPISLFPDARGHWVSQDKVYVLTPVAGNYPVNVTGTSLYGNKSPGYTVFAISDFYQVRDIAPLTFEVEEPNANTKLACNVIAAKTPVGQTIEVRIKLLDKEGNAVHPENYLLSEPSMAFTAVLTGLDGTQLDEITLTPSSLDIGVFEGKLLDRQEVIGCGRSKLVIAFKGNYDDTRFVFKNPERTIEVSRPISVGVLASPALDIPKQNQIHPGFCSDQLLTVPFEFKLTNLDGKRISPKDIAVGDPADLFTVRLSGPNSDQWEDLKASVESRSDGDVLVVSGGISVTTPGEYSYLVTVNPNAFRDGFVPADEGPIQVTFARSDSWLAQPSTCQTAKFSGLGIFSAIILLVIFLLTGGPGGVIEITAMGNTNDVKAAFKLSKARVFNKIKNKQLEVLGIDTIKYSTGAQRSVDVSIIDLVDKAELLNTNLVRNEEVTLNTDYDIVYR